MNSGCKILLSIMLLISTPTVIMGLDKPGENPLTVQDCNICRLSCEDEDLSYYGHSRVIFDNGRQKRLVYVSENIEGSKGYSMSFYLIDGPKCRPILNIECSGSIAMFLDKIGSSYPYIVGYWSVSAFKADYHYYTWNGSTYVKLTGNIAAIFNKESIQLIKKGELKKAVEYLQMAAQEDEADTEVLNNLGFAHYLLAAQEDPYTNYREARRWISKALEIDPKRWSAYLNLGDLFFDHGDVLYAAQNYRRLLEIKPSYSATQKIKDRILELIRQPVSNEITTPSTDPVTHSVVYARLDKQRVERKELFEDDKLFSSHILRNGYADGEYASYWRNGNIRVKGQFVKGIRVGVFTYFDEKGSQIKEVVYDDKNHSSQLEEEHASFEN